MTNSNRRRIVFAAAVTLSNLDLLFAEERQAVRTADNHVQEPDQVGSDPQAASETAKNLQAELQDIKLDALELETTEREKRLFPTVRSLPDQQTRTRKVFIVSNRAYQDGPDRTWLPTRGDTLSFGYCQVIKVGDRKRGALPPNSTPTKAVEQTEWKREIKRTADKIPALVFVHGYRCTANEAIIRAAQLAEDIAFRGPVVVFCWPSRGQLKAYTVDSTEAEWSEQHFSQTLTMLLDAKVQLNLVAHSMGSRIVVRTLSNNVNLLRNIRALALCAPDIDSQTFWNIHAEKLRVLGSKLSIYMSAQDLAIQASKIIGGYERLGDPSHKSPSNYPFQLMDLSSAWSWLRAAGHSYVFDTAEMLNDLWAFIVEDLPPARRTWLKLNDDGRWHIK